MKTRLRRSLLKWKKLSLPQGHVQVVPRESHGKFRAGEEGFELAEEICFRLGFESRCMGRNNNESTPS